MIKLLVAAGVIACLATPAAAQMGGRRSQGDQKKSESSGPKIDDKAYKAALERIPEPKEKYDPWGGVAPTPAKKTK
ncbi:hypothetical protein BH11PSE4_BH11PSE4_21120 [soil metagenome]